MRSVSIEHGLCGMDYVGYTNRYLHQSFAKYSSLNSNTGMGIYDMHGMSKQNLTNNFFVLKKCCYKFHCLIHVDPPRSFKN